MSWVRLDDNFTFHNKVVGLSDGAFRAHVEALCMVARNHTDGRVDAGPAARFHWDQHANELTVAGLWEPGDNGSYTIHDYLDYNPSKAEFEQMTNTQQEQRRAARGPEAPPRADACKLQMGPEFEMLTVTQGLAY